SLGLNPDKQDLSATSDTPGFKMVCFWTVCGLGYRRLSIDAAELIRRRANPRMTSRRRLFENRTALIVTPLVSISLSVWSWLSIAKHVPREPVNIFGVAKVFDYVFLLLVAASVAFRAPFWADRVVFGVIAAVVLLIAIKKATVPLTFVEML